MKNHPDVLIVGAGPSGLMAAALLHHHEIKFRIIDQAIKPVATSNALGMQSRSIEILDDLGLAAEAVRRGVPIQKLNVFADSNKLAEISLSQLPSKYNFLLGISQHETETLLLDHLRIQGITVEMETELSGLQIEGTQIAASLKKKDGDTELVKCTYLLACDGGNSFVRRQLNIPFEGHELLEHFIMADGLLQANLAHNEIYSYLTSKGTVAIIPYGNKYTRIIIDVSHNKALKKEIKPSVDVIAKIANDYLPFPVKFSEIVWTSGFWIHRRLIRTYQHGNLFFIGDSAHLHSPVGGQGMNTGLQDAYNLTWKLALVLKNKAKPEILLSYQQERRPVAKAVLKGASFMTRVISLNYKILKAARNFVMKQLLKSQTLKNKFAATVSELSINYRKSMLSSEHRPSYRFLRAGDRFIHFNIKQSANALRLLEMLRGKGHTLIIFQASSSLRNCLKDIQQIFNLLAQKNIDFIDTILISHDTMQPDKTTHTQILVDHENQVHALYRVEKPLYMLVRPDKYIALVANLNQQDALWQYLQRFYHLCA